MISLILISWGEDGGEERGGGRGEGRVARFV